MWDAALSRRGVYPVAGVDDLCDALVAIRRVGLSPGKRLLVVGGGGGLGTYAADLAEAAGLEIPSLDHTALEGVASVLQGAGAVAGNPVDIGAPLIPLPMMEEIFRKAGRNTTTDIVVFDLALNFGALLGGEHGLCRVAELLVTTRRESEKPVVAVLYSRACDPDDLEPERLLRKMRGILHEGGVAVFPSMARAMRALALVNRFPR